VSAAGEKLGLLNVNAVIINKRLQLVLDYSKKQYKEQTMSNLTERLRSNLLMLLEHCMSRDKTQSTPSDFLYNEITFEELNDVYEALD
jgi:fengycin family lipopeptide synthetase D/gramicidin S synthase 2/tyrocidine synthetase-2